MSHYWPRADKGGSTCGRESRGFFRDHKPRLRAALAEGHLLEVRTDFETDGADGFDRPAGGEGLAELGLRNAARALGAGFLVAEAGEVYLAARASDVCEAGDV